MMLLKKTTKAQIEQENINKFEPDKREEDELVSAFLTYESYELPKWWELTNINLNFISSLIFHICLEFVDTPNII